MFALIDCNAFYVSCERIFQPHLEKKPVIVLSSNDGCAIARSSEAKALGIPMGAPLFKIRDMIKKHNIHVFSANFSLYGDISSRVMEALKAFSPILEVYSIDEAFLDLSTLSQDELFAYGCDIRKIVKKWTGIPVSVGIGPTKTLAKVANSMAKRHPSGCYALLTPEKTKALLGQVSLQDVWGIGSRWSKKLNTLGLTTALELAQADPRWIKKAFNIVLARTALELKGKACLSVEETAPSKKSMISSRSFGIPLTTFEDLREAISFHASSLAYRLRVEGRKTSLLSISVRTNPFDKKGRFYSNTHLIPLSCPSQDNATLITAATLALDQVFREHLSYKKVAVMALNLSPEDQKIPSLFTEEKENEHSLKRRAVLKSIDQLNYRYGKGSLVFASEGVNISWQPKATWKSPSFTQNWKQLPEVS
ncbi:MAG: Y-family DNA polymerase [Alphaproteobacteria bacterium]|nr:Y-family DNA polymerase [Alphaproteobacteria bacterium]